MQLKDMIWNRDDIMKFDFEFDLIDLDKISVKKFNN